MESKSTFKPHIDSFWCPVKSEKSVVYTDSVACLLQIYFLSCGVKNVLLRTNTTIYLLSTNVYIPFTPISQFVCPPAFLPLCPSLYLFYSTPHPHIFSFNICSSPQLFAICCLKQSSFLQSPFCFIVLVTNQQMLINMDAVLLIMMRETRTRYTLIHDDIHPVFWNGIYISTL